MEELRALVIAAQDGDHEAFGRIVTRFQDMVYAVEYAILYDSRLAWDAAQEAFLAAYLACPSCVSPPLFLVGFVGF